VEVVVRRCVPVLVTSAVVVAALAAPATAAPGGGRTPAEYPGVRNILPPGQSGSINAAEAALVAAGDPEGRRAVELTYDEHIDDIRATTAGVIGVRDIDWQNRRRSSR
jgi:hypothetical protein